MEGENATLRTNAPIKSKWTSTTFLGKSPTKGMLLVLLYVCLISLFTVFVNHREIMRLTTMSGNLGTNGQPADISRTLLPESLTKNINASNSKLLNLLFSSEAEQLAACGAYGSRSFSGLPHEPKESVVVVSMDGESEEEALGAVLRAFTDNDHANTTSAYQKFMRERRVSVTVPPALSPEDFRYDAASHERVARRALAVSALSIDVVYTYANPNSASFREIATKTCGSACPLFNFRDFDELRYSMRAVERFVLESDGLASTVFEGGAGGATRAERVGRNVHLVVASADQVPAWVDRSHPRVRVVEHADTFGTFEDESVNETVPSMNSMAIETTLHRIGGLSRFYMYFNNDVIVTRPVSVFDYFRPLAPERQQLYRMFYGNGGYGDVLRSDAVLYPSAVGGGELGERESGQPRKRFAFFFESLSHMEQPDDFLPVFRNESNVKIPSSCLPHIPLRTSTLFKLPPLRRDANLFLSYQYSTRQRFLERYDGAFPTGLYMHLPLMYDRDMMTLFLDHGMRDAARDTRTQRLRTNMSFLTGDVYPFFITAVRRGIERKVIVERTLNILRDAIYRATQVLGVLSENQVASLVKSAALVNIKKAGLWFRGAKSKGIHGLPELSHVGPLYEKAFSGVLQLAGDGRIFSRGNLSMAWNKYVNASGLPYQKLYMDIPLTLVDPNIVGFICGFTGRSEELFNESIRLDSGYAPLSMTVNDDFVSPPSEDEMLGMKTILEAASRHLGPSSFEVQQE